MKTAFFLLTFVSALLGAYLPLSAQKVIADKTTSEGRFILTSMVNCSLIDNDKGALNYFSYGDGEVFQLLMVFSGRGITIKEGYKLLFKQKSGNIMELTCFSGERKQEIYRVPLLWVYDVATFEDANYWLTREEVESIISDPVYKMRVEYHNGYFDIGLRNEYGSRLSIFIEKAYKEINKALQTKKTGLYDGF